MSLTHATCVNAQDCCGNNSSEAHCCDSKGVPGDADTTYTTLDERMAMIDACIDTSLRKLILPDDYDCLVMNRENALDILSALDATAYGIGERDMVRRLLTQQELAVSSQELSAYRKVRSIQVNNSGIFSYPYFACRFTRRDGRIFFEKTSGSQRKSGFVYDNRPTSKLFLGGWSVNNDPQTAYGSENSQAGMLYKTAADRLMMLFVVPGRSFEIYELKK